MSKLSLLAAIALAVASTSAFAQTPPATQPAPAKPAATPPPAAGAAATTAKKERTPESLKCSADADAKGLKGDERKKFRATCMKDAKKAAKAAGAAPEPKKN